MDNKKRNILLICAAIIIGSYFARSFVTSYRRMVQQQALRNRQTPKPKQEPKSPSAVAVDEMTGLMGVWQSHGQVPGGRGMCDFRLELKQNDPDHYTAFSRFACMSNQAITQPKDANFMQNYLNHLNPDSAILSGTVEKQGSIHFTTDKAIGTDINNCSVTEIDVTPFGASAIAAEWKEGTCAGGSLMMTRTGR